MSVLITAGLGTWLAYLWQQRSASESRYFEASKTQYEQMKAAARDMAKLAGERLYATQRICRLPPTSPYFDEAKDEFRRIILTWNRQHLQMDLDVRTLFRESSVVSFEYLQSRMTEITVRVLGSIEQNSHVAPDALIRDIQTLRGDYFSFLQGMIDEANHVFRQMHFGVTLKYDKQDLHRYSTWDLTKVLFTGPDQESAILRSPTDFGLPVSTSDARLGINEH